MRVDDRAVIAAQQAVDTSLDVTEIDTVTQPIVSRLVPRPVRLTCFGLAQSPLPTNTRTSYTPGDRSRIVAMAAHASGGV